jgi:hypothetical protein
MSDPKAAAASSTPATVWKQRYEALRQLAIGGRQILQSDPLGLVLLLREGVAGWMRSWSELTPTTPFQSASVQPPVASTSGWQQQLTQVLAEMSLAHLPNRAAL